MFNQLMQMMGEMTDPSTCINCSKPLAEGDAGVDGLFPNSKICTPCEEARVRLANKVQEGITITYRDGTEVTIGGETINPFGLRLFRVGNTGKHPSWVFAENADEAKEIFFRNTSTRKIENVRIIKENLISDWDNRTDINQVGVKGVACVRMDGMNGGGTWIVTDNGQRLKG